MKILAGAATLRRSRPVRRALWPTIFLMIGFSGGAALVESRVHGLIGAPGVPGLTTLLGLATLMTAIASLFTSGSVWYSRQANRQSAQQHSYDTLMSLRAKFDAEEMLQARRATALAILARWKDDHDADYIPAMDEIIDHFEMLGFLCSHGVLDWELVWFDMSSMVLKYCEAGQAYIAASTQDDPTVWEYLQLLRSRLVQIEVAKRREPETKVLPTREQLRLFLGEESLHLIDGGDVARF